jgi:peptidoglycan/LPS O-acetylase OafA/YrhL
MPENPDIRCDQPGGDQTRVASLVGGIIEDTQLLIRQEMALARRELQEEWAKTKSAAALLAGAAFAGGLAAILLCFCIVYAIAVGLPYLWACFLIVGGALALIAAAVALAGMNQMKQVHVVPPQTTESVRRDVRAVASAVSGPGPYVRQ